MTTTVITARTDWHQVLDLAREIVATYDTGVTLRQLFYRLVAAEILPNTSTAYKSLSSRTAAARRDQDFPALVDLTRNIHRAASWNGPRAALGALVRQYRRDRTEGQRRALYLGVEKHGLLGLLEWWFGELGVPILALGGYASQSYADQVTRHVEADGRPAVLLYAGDFDPTGEDILRDLEARTSGFDDVIRIALTWEQVEAHDLPPQMGKASDSRAAAFEARHGRLVQVELDALPPEILRTLYQDAIDGLMDKSIFEDALRRERSDAARLGALIAHLDS